MDTQEQKNSYTLQFMFMTTKVNSSGWWTFVSKGSGAYYPGKGWAVHAQYGNYNIDAGGRYYSNAPVNDGNWHVLTFVFDTEKKKLRIYTDGVMGSENSLPTTLNDVGDPLIIGHMKDSDPINGPFCVSNLQFYNVALPEDFIKKNCGKPVWKNLKMSIGIICWAIGPMTVKRIFRKNLYMTIPNTETGMMIAILIICIGETENVNG